MKRMTLLLLWILSIAPALNALQAACPQVVHEVIQSMAEVCSDISRNQVCYGNFYIDSILDDDAPEDVQFEQAGDIAGVAAFESLRLSPVDTETDRWGVALMQLQANLPNTMPGQNVTFVLFGDVEMTSAVDPNSGASPMQAFYLRTGIGAPGCEEAPSSGLLVNTPKGAGKIEFAMNGMNISMGSTVFFQVTPDREMSVSTLEGAAALRSGEQVIPVVQGSRVRIPMNDDFTPDGSPYTIEPYDSEALSTLPLDLLDDPDFEMAEPLEDDEVADLMARIEAGEPLCGEDWLMDCDSIPWELGGTACALDEDGEEVCDLPEFAWGDEGFGDEDYADLSFYDEFFDEFSEMDFDELEEFGLGDEFFDDDEFADDEFLDDEFIGEEPLDEEPLDELTDDEFFDEEPLDEFTDDEFFDEEPVDEFFEEEPLNEGPIGEDPAGDLLDGGG